jgi:hypothetical protein
MIKEMVNRTSELVTLKASFTSEIVSIINSKSPAIAEKIWSEYEVAFLRQGTTKKQVQLFSNQFLLTMFDFVFKELMENIEDDVTGK